MNLEVPFNWYEDFFHGITLDLWRQAIPPRQTEAEADFLVKTLQCEPGGHLLDAPCGNGRLSFALRNRGYRVTGVDISKEFIAEAQGWKSSAMQSSANVDDSAIDFILGDMRQIDGSAIYDGAFCFGNSFGFMEYADMEKFLRGVATALKPGARFVIETGMAAESVLPDFEEQTSHEVGDISVIIKERYAAEQSCIFSEYIFERDDQVESRKACHWIYTVAEIRRMLERAGLEVTTLYGSLSFEPYRLGSQELFVVSKCREGADSLKM